MAQTQTFFACIPSSEPVLGGTGAVLKKGLTFYRSELDASFVPWLFN